MVRLSGALCGLLWGLSACTSVDITDTQRCPAIKPVGIECKAFVFDRESFPTKPDTIEALEERYLEALAQLLDADTINSRCYKRNEIWDTTWNNCGQIVDE